MKAFYRNETDNTHEMGVLHCSFGCDWTIPQYRYVVAIDNGGEKDLSQLRVC